LEYVPCAKRLADAHVSTVVIGMFDPDPGIHQDGWRILHDAGVALRDFPMDLREQVAAMNVEFIEQYRAGHGDTGWARFDYTQNDGRFPIDTTAAGSFDTRWSGASGVSIWAYDDTHGVALARHATAFDQIDDPSAYAGTRVVGVGEGQICIFRNQTGWLLVKVEDVMAPDRGDDRWQTTIAWEARGGGRSGPAW
jgi:diaminohydroxyphosphoribosylaminopyrimidine deaminase/5-amino-6-(5-phosphoribosylamino)uracil reductase